MERTFMDNVQSVDLRRSCNSVGEKLRRSVGQFSEARRVQNSLLATAEKKTLIWLAKRTPAWINSDHLTLLGFLSLVGVAAAYYLARWFPMALLVVNFCLALNWLGDSLDGTLARVRNCQRPRYGFYVDH